VFEQQPEPSRIVSALTVFAGLLVGLVGALSVTVAVFVVTSGIPGLGTNGRNGVWVAEILNCTLLGLGGYLTYRNTRHSAAASGALIGISIAFLLNAICGIGVFVSR
jgi:hypothetical protein